ncbi:MAG: His/Gly/Thr/Pro-type tRNA ligase C-terminal domain-containing protein, partial [Pseudomonadota bacterium]
IIGHAIAIHNSDDHRAMRLGSDAPGCAQGRQQSMVAELRSAGIRAEVYLGNPRNFGNQLKYADKRNSPIAIIEGGDEKERGVVQIKDLILGAKIAETATHEEWKDRPSQFEVPRDQMLAKVREILGQ